MAATAEEIDVDGVMVRITNRDKVFFPKLGANGTKGKLIDYYRSVGAGPLLTALRNRPTHLQRFPDGIDGEMIYQKRVPEKHPDYLETCRVTFPSGRTADALMPTHPSAVVWAAQMGTITYAPNLREHILDRVIITPDDLHNEYLITDGNIFHGSMMLDQLFGARPIPELANYRTPVRNYYLCGSGTHPGGGVMGANGHNAAKAALADADGVAPAAPLRPVGTRAPWQQRMVGTLMGTRPGRWFGYQAARQPALRKITAYAARVR